MEPPVKGPPASRHQAAVVVTLLKPAAPALEGAVPVREGASLAELYRAHAQDVGRWARRLGGPLIDAEDVVQEVFIIAHRRLGTFRHDSQASTWLFGITHNVVRHRRRKDRLRTWLTGTAERAAAEHLSPDPSASDQLMSRQATAQLYRVLDQLPERARTVLVLFELEGLSGEEIAQLLGAKTATVWVWLHRARADFLKRMQSLRALEDGS